MESGSSDTEEWIELESTWFGSKTLERGGDFLYGWGVSSSGAWRMKIEYEERVEERMSQFSRSHLSTVTL